MANDAGTKEEYSELQGKRILVVEDDPLVAVDYHFQLRAVGMTQSLQPTIMRALEYLANHEVDAAIVDYQLPDGDCEPVLEQLVKRHIPFLVVSGDTFGMRDIAAGAPVLSKPLLTAEIYRNLADILAAGEAPSPAREATDAG